MVSHLPRPPPRPQGRQRIHRGFVFPGPIDVSFREPVRCWLRKVVCSREAEIKPAARRDPRRPSISRGLQIRRQKEKASSVLLQTSMVLFILLPRPSSPPTPCLYSLSRAPRLQRASLISSAAQRPGDQRLVAGVSARGLCKEESAPLFSGSAPRAGRGEWPVSGRCVWSRCEGCPHERVPRRQLSWVGHSLCNATWGHTA